MISGILPTAKNAEHPSETEYILYKHLSNFIQFPPTPTKTIHIAQPGSLEVAASVYEEWRNEVPWAEAAFH